MPRSGPVVRRAPRPGPTGADRTPEPLLPAPEGILNQGYEYVPIESVHPHPENPRQGDVGAICESIEANQFFGALVVQRSTGNILIGNHRHQAAAHKGLKQIPVIWVDCDDDRARRIMLADNRTNDLASYNDASLVALLQELDRTDDGLSGTGYDQDALDELLAELGMQPAGTEGLTDDDAVPEVPVRPVTRLGDLWLLGGHTICPHCGTLNAS